MNIVSKAAERAVASALRLRATQGISPREPIRAIDLAEKIGIDVRLIALPTMEGTFIADPATIFISSLRPSGRRAFTCAHELGHWSFGDTFAIDEIQERRERPPARGSNEWAAQVFAGTLLMPRPAVETAFMCRGWDIRTTNELQTMTVASVFGVGHTTLIDHLSYSLKLLPISIAEQIKKKPLPLVKEQLIGIRTTANLCVVDAHWPSIPIDLEIGDLIYVYAGADGRGCFIGCELVQQMPQTDGRGGLWRACTQGIATVSLANGVKANIRVTKQGFTGRARYRYLAEDPNDSQS